MMKGAKQLRNMICNILENSDAVSGVTLKNSPNSSELLLDQANGKGRMTFHTLFPGLTLAFIFVNIDKTEHINAFRSQITVLPGVLECHHLAGAYGYLLKVSVSDTDALESFLTNKLKKITGVSSSNTFITLATLKEELNC